MREIPAVECTQPGPLKVYSDKVFFGCTGHSNDNELWAYDGVNAPFLAVNIDPDGSSYPLALGTFNGTLFIQTGDDRSKGTIVAYNGTSVETLESLD